MVITVRRQSKSYCNLICLATIRTIRIIKENRKKSACAHGFRDSNYPFSLKLLILYLFGVLNLIRKSSESSLDFSFSIKRFWQFRQTFSSQLFLSAGGYKCGCTFFSLSHAYVVTTRKWHRRKQHSSRSNSNLLQIIIVILCCAELGT